MTKWPEVKGFVLFKNLSHFLQDAHLLCRVSAVCVRKLNIAMALIAQQPLNKFPLGGREIDKCILPLLGSL